MYLLAMDFDGTLVLHHVARQADAEAPTHQRAAGNLLVLAMGRSVRLVWHAVRVAWASTFIGPDYDCTVCATGTTVIDVVGQTHHIRTLETDQVRVVVRAVDDVTQAPVLVFASVLERDYVLDDPIGLPTDQYTPLDHSIVAPPPQVADLGVTSMPLHIPDVRTLAVLASGLEEIIGGISCTCSTSFVDIIATGESKGMGLGRLAELLADQGMEVSEVTAVGDSWNNVSVFEQADIPCAMAGVLDEVVETAGGHTTPSMAAFIDALLA